MGDTRRAIADVEARLSSQSQVVVGRERELQAISVDDSGVAEIEIEIPPHALTGRHSLELEIAGEVIGQYLYQVEEFVYFSHQAHHLDAGVACAECHGEVEKRETLFQEKSVRMYACMQCHERYQAPNDCDLCHDSH